MTPDVSSRVRAILQSRLGWAQSTLDPIRLESAIQVGVTKFQLNAESFLRHLETGSGPEFQSLVAELAVGETYFFRDGAQFRVIERLLRQSTKSIRVLSAGCASGEEPYSIAILMLSNAVRGRVVGLDVNPTALDVARRAHYSPWALRETPASTLEAWFTRKGKQFVLSQAPRQLVELREANLHESDLSALGEWDVILCRNLLMYHERVAAAEIVAKLARQLSPSGYLFLGHAETLRGISEDFEVLQAEGTFFYRRVETPTTRGHLPSVAPSTAASDATWFNSIGSATDRIAALTRSTPPPPVNEARGWLTLVWEHVARGEPTTALDLLDTLPEAAQATALTIRAALLLMAGREHQARRVADSLVTNHVDLPEANYVIGLCKTQDGDSAGAIRSLDHSHALDPSFAMPLVQAGLHLLRVGDTRGGRIRLARATKLLPTETEQRILLFGGGFSREALRRICRSAEETP